MKPQHKTHREINLLIDKDLDEDGISEQVPNAWGEGAQQDRSLISGEKRVLGAKMSDHDLRTLKVIAVSCVMS